MFECMMIVYLPMNHKKVLKKIKTHLGVPRCVVPRFCLGSFLVLGIGIGCE